MRPSLWVVVLGSVIVGAIAVGLLLVPGPPAHAAWSALV